MTAHESPPGATNTSLLYSVASNWGALFIAAFSGIFLTGFVVRFVGEAAFGVYALLGAITAQTVLADLGMRQALAKFLAERPLSPERVRSIFASARQIVTASSYLTIFAHIGILVYLTSWFDIPEGYRSQANIVFVILAADAVLELFFGMNEGACAARERFDIVALASVRRVLLHTAIAGVLVSYGCGIVGVAASLFVTRLAQRVWLSRKVRALYPELDGTRGDPQSTRSALLSFGMRAFGYLASQRITTQIDTILVGLFFAPSTVAAYALPLMLSEQLRVFTNSAQTVLTPRLAHSAHDSQEHAVQPELRYAERWMKFSLLAATAAAVPLGVFSEEILRVWLGAIPEGSTEILQVLVISQVVATPSLTVIQVLYARNAHGIAARYGSLEAGLNLALSVLLALKIGPLGVALGTLIPTLLVRTVLLFTAVERSTKLPVWLWLRAALSTSITSVVLTIGGTIAVKYGGWSESAGGLILSLVVAGSISLCLSWNLAFSKEERHEVLDSIVRRLHQARRLATARTTPR